ncbi:MAG TPA: hypothetical protein VJ246_03625 [Patescibacteria group bacterium]|nr:hypothetical protein [Patescibacteria group bacterium]
MSTREKLPIDDGKHIGKTEVLQNTNFLLIIVGATSSGKSMVIHHLLERYPHIKNIVSYTTRKKRPTEVDGVFSHFISEEDFIAKRDSLVCVTERTIEGVIAHYGVQKEDLDQVLSGGAAAMHHDMETASCFKEELEKLYTPEEVNWYMSKVLTIFLGTSSLFTLKQRYLHRDRVNDSKETFIRRLRHEWILWNRLYGFFPHVVMNDGSIGTVLDEMAQLLNARK